MTTTEFILDDSELRQEAPEPRPDKKLPKKQHRSVWRIILNVFLTFLGVVVFIAFSLYALFFIIPNAPEVALSKNANKQGPNPYQTEAADLTKINNDLVLLDKK